MSEELDLLRRIAFAVEKLAGSSQPVNAALAVASDADLDGPYGDPIVKFTPRDWHGANLKGAKFSECPSEFLLAMASAFDYFASKNDEAGAVDAKGRNKSYYDRQAAARARGWAARNAGKQAAPVAMKWADDDL